MKKLIFAIMIYLAMPVSALSAQNTSILVITIVHDSGSSTIQQISEFKDRPRCEMAGMIYSDRMLNSKIENIKVVTVCVQTNPEKYFQP
jgi:hypothetical protein